jgi:hypothetical protein
MRSSMAYRPTTTVEERRARQNADGSNRCAAWLSTDDDRLRPIVRVLDGVVQRRRGRSPIAWPTPPPCRDDLERWAVVADCIREEPARSDAVAAFRHVQVDDPAMVIDGAVDVTPHARRLHIGLVDEPVVTNGISVRVSCVDQYRCEALHPSEQRDVINLDNAFGEEFFEIAVSDSVAHVPADTSIDHLRREPEPCKRR